MTTQIACPFPECDYETDEVTEAVAIALLNAHIHVHSHPPQAPAATASVARMKGPRLEQPRIEAGVTTEKWNAFVRRWETFKDGSDIDNNSATLQLFYCAHEALGDIILRAEKTFASKPLTEALQIMKSFTVIPVARGVLCSDLAAMRQNNDEPFHNFAAKVCRKAETCDFKVLCGSCQEVICDVILHGVADDNIRHDALGAPDSHTKTVSEVIAFVEGKETARDAHPSPSLNASSTYRRTNAAPQPPPMPSRRNTTSAGNNAPPTAAEKAKTASCPGCRKPFYLFTELRRGWNRTPHDVSSVGVQNVDVLKSLRALRQAPLTLTTTTSLGRWPALVLLIRDPDSILQQ
jgi:hypothetical protein